MDPNITCMQPIISIILPAYNGRKTIARSIASVQAQTYGAWELLVIDDGSTDGTGEVVQALAEKDSRIRYIKNEANLGIQKTLNIGLREAKGAYIARIDDDDFWTIDYKLSAQYAYLRLHENCVLVGTGVSVVDEQETELFRYLLPETDANIRHTILSKNCFTHSAVLFSKKAALAAGGYGEGADTKHVEDYDLWLRLGTAGTLANLPLYATGFTLRAGSISAEHKREQFEKDMALAKKYRYAYPGYVRAVFRGTIRAVLYRFYDLVPKSLQHSVLRWYKKHW
jgi:glycosyltransferase involved in cell wall biosynthesis